VWPCIRRIAEAGLKEAVEEMPRLARGIATKDGKITSEPLAAAYYAGNCAGMGE
jgi:alanine dehydrogenase